MGQPLDAPAYLILTKGTEHIGGMTIPSVTHIIYYDRERRQAFDFTLLHHYHEPLQKVFRDLFAQQQLSCRFLTPVQIYVLEHYLTGKLVVGSTDGLDEFKSVPLDQSTWEDMDYYSDGIQDAQQTLESRLAEFRNSVTYNRLIDLLPK